MKQTPEPKPTRLDELDLKRMQLGIAQLENAKLRVELAQKEIEVLTKDFEIRYGLASDGKDDRVVIDPRTGAFAVVEAPPSPALAVVPEAAG